MENIIDEWDYEKNQSINLTEISPFSHKKVWWKCKLGHSWEISVSHRSRGSSCPYCCNQRVLEGYNDLLSRNPDLAKEWNYEKNEDLKPSQVSTSSSQKVWWKCVRGHEWVDTINHRSNGRGCPICNKGLKTSFPEQSIYYYMRQVFPDAENRFMELGFELDIYVPSIKLGIEYDGGIYHQNSKREYRKIQQCIENGINLYKIREPECCFINDSRIKIYSLQNHSIAELEKVIRQLFADIKKEYNISFNPVIDLVKDNIFILQMIGEKELENSLANTRPELAKEWDYEKNGSLMPEMISGKSNQKVWWKCPNCGNSWKQSPNIRKSTGYCLRCISDFVKQGENDLQTVRPYLADEWNYQRNEGKPNEYTNTSNALVWWKCSDCGMEWEETIASRNRKVFNNIKPRCPQCEKRWKPKPKSGWYKASPKIVNENLLELFPEVAIEWDEENNNGFLPENVTYSSGYRASWICPKGHKYKAIVSNRTTKGSGCPYCSNKKVLIGYNDLATTHPDLIKEWIVEKNLPITPDSVIGGSKKIWWRCLKCKNEWQASISVRKSGSGCPICAGIKRAEHKKKSVGMYDIKTGELIRVFSSVQEAELEFHNKNIGSVCNGNRKSAAGYVWKHI